MTRLRDQSGFSLVNIVVGLGIGAIVTMAFVTTVQMMNKAKKTSDVKVVASTFIDELQQATHRPQSCQTNFANGSNYVPTAGGETDVTFGNVMTGSNLGNGAVISKLKFKLANTAAINVPGVNLKSVTGRIEVVVANSTTNPPTLLRSRFVPVQVTYDPAQAGKIVSCASVDTSAKICEQLDGVWDATAPAGLECTPTDKCLYGGAYSTAPVGGTDGNGQPNPGFINTFTGGQSCPTGFAAQQTGTVSVARRAGKYHVATDTYPSFTCVRCQTPVANQASNGMTSEDLDPTGQGFADEQTSAAAGASYSVDIAHILSTLGTAIP